MYADTECNKLKVILTFKKYILTDKIENGELFDCFIQ